MNRQYVFILILCVFTENSRNFLNIRKYICRSRNDRINSTIFNTFISIRLATTIVYACVERERKVSFFSSFKFNESRVQIFMQTLIFFYIFRNKSACFNAEITFPRLLRKQAQTLPYFFKIKQSASLLLQKKMKCLIISSEKMKCRIISTEKMLIFLKK